jgi:hypothetical protein
VSESSWGIAHMGVVTILLLLRSTVKINIVYYLNIAVGKKGFELENVDLIGRLTMLPLYSWFSG